MLRLDQMTPEECANFLDDQEKRLMACIALGWSYQEIAERWQLAGGKKEVEAQAVRLKKKLGIMRGRGVHYQRLITLLYVNHILPLDVLNEPGRPDYANPGEKYDAWKKQAEAARQMLRQLGRLTERNLALVKRAVDPLHVTESYAELGRLKCMGEGAVRTRFSAITSVIGGGMNGLVVAATLAPFDE